MSRVDQARSFVLHRRAYRETSLIVELFSREHGCIAAVARGARSARSPMRGLSEPFVELQASWSRRGEMATLIALEPAQAGSPPRYGGQALWCGLYLNELVLKLLARDDPEPALFDAYADVLFRLNDQARQAQHLRSFEWLLLQTIGVAPDLSVCCDTGEAIEADGLYRVDPHDGPVRIDRPNEAAVSGKTLLGLCRGVELSKAEARSARHLLRRLIETQLDGRTLQTPRMFRSQR
ncbi:MAG: DNA repair protein RecO [Pseudomonadota bacterium]